MNILKNLLSSLFSIFQSSKKAIALAVVICFFVSSVCHDVAAAVAMPTADATQYKQIFTDFILPYSYGKITKSHFAGTDRVIINIQDLHCHPQVQKNISNIIEMFDKKYGVTNVYLEGAYGDVSTKWLTENIKNDKKKTEILNKILGTGKLTGAEYYSASSEKTEIIKGLEKKEPYLDNLKRFGDLLEKQDEIQIILKGIEESTAKVKKQYYTKRQYKIEELSQEYISGSMRPEKYYRLLSKHTEKLGIDLTKYENTYTYIKLLALQKQLDYKAITSQLQALVMILKEKLPYNAYKMLLDNTKNFEQTDKLYAYIIKISRDFGLDLTVNFKELNKYFNYIELSQKINPLELLKEEERLTREINTRFSDTVAQREVVFLTHFEKYLKDYMSTKITSDDYEYYKENIETYKRLYNKYVDNKVFSLLKPYMDEVDVFYKINNDRNDYFTENLFDGIETYEIENIKEEPKETNKIIENMDQVTRLDVIVTGGFHSQTVTEILQEQGVSYIVITPNVQGGVKEAEKTYYQIAKEQKEINFQTLANLILSLDKTRQAFMAEQFGIKITDLEPEKIEYALKQSERFNDIVENNEEKLSKILSDVNLEKKLESDDPELAVLEILAKAVLGKDAQDEDVQKLKEYMVDIINNKKESTLSKILSIFGANEKLEEDKDALKEIILNSELNDFIKEADGKKLQYDKEEQDIYFEKDGESVYLKKFAYLSKTEEYWNSDYSDDEYLQNLKGLNTVQIGKLKIIKDNLKLLKDNGIIEEYGDIENEVWNEVDWMQFLENSEIIKAIIDGVKKNEQYDDNYDNKINKQLENLANKIWGSNSDEIHLNILKKDLRPIENYIRYKIINKELNENESLGNNLTESLKNKAIELGRIYSEHYDKYIYNDKNHISIDELNRIYKDNDMNCILIKNGVGLNVSNDTEKYNFIELFNKTENKLNYEIKQQNPTFLYIEENGDKKTSTLSNKFDALTELLKYNSLALTELATLNFETATENDLIALVNYTGDMIEQLEKIDKECAKKCKNYLNEIKGNIKNIKEQGTIKAWDIETLELENSEDKITLHTLINIVHQTGIKALATSVKQEGTAQQSASRVLRTTNRGTEIVLYDLSETKEITPEIKSLICKLSDNQNFSEIGSKLYLKDNILIWSEKIGDKHSVDFVIDFNARSITIDFTDTAIINQYYSSEHLAALRIEEYYRPVLEKLGFKVDTYNTGYINGEKNKELEPEKNQKIKATFVSDTIDSNFVDIILNSMKLFKNSQYMDAALYEGNKKIHSSSYGEMEMPLSVERAIKLFNNGAITKFDISQWGTVSKKDKLSFKQMQEIKNSLNNILKNLGLEEIPEGALTGNTDGHGDIDFYQQDIDKYFNEPIEKAYMQGRIIIEDGVFKKADDSENVVENSFIKMTDVVFSDDDDDKRKTKNFQLIGQVLKAVPEAIKYYESENYVGNCLARTGVIKLSNGEKIYVKELVDVQGNIKLAEAELIREDEKGNTERETLSSEDLIAKLNDEGWGLKEESLWVVESEIKDIKQQLQTEATGIQEQLVKGLIASKGKEEYVVGTAIFNVEKISEDNIPILPYTTPDDVETIKKAKGIITISGSILSHAAITTKEYGKPSLIISAQWKEDEEGKYLEIVTHQPEGKVSEKNNGVKVQKAKEEIITIREGDKILMSAENGFFIKLDPSEEYNEKDIEEKVNKNKAGDKSDNKIKEEILKTVNDAKKEFTYKEHKDKEGIGIVSLFSIISNQIEEFGGKIVELAKMKEEIEGATKLKEELGKLGIELDVSDGIGVGQSEISKYLGNDFDNLYTQFRNAIETGNKEEAHNIADEIIGLIDGIDGDIITDKKLLDKDKKYAVRSSGVGEDGTEHAFAGMGESKLNVAKENIDEQIKEVWKSFFSDRAIDYMIESCIAVKPAVLVQEMVEADFAGVSFSRNERGNLIINVVRGLGEGVVSGRENSDSIEVNSNTFEIISYNQSGRYRIFQNKKQVEALARTVMYLEANFGRPVDTEFAFKGNKLYMLQRRADTKFSGIEQKTETKQTEKGVNFSILSPKSLQNKLNELEKEEKNGTLSFKQKIEKGILSLFSPFWEEGVFGFGALVLSVGLSFVFAGPVIPLIGFFLWRVVIFSLLHIYSDIEEFEDLKSNGEIDKSKFSFVLGRLVYRLAGSTLLSIPYLLTMPMSVVMPFAATIGGYALGVALHGLLNFIAGTEFGKKLKLPFFDLTGPENMELKQLKEEELKQNNEEKEIEEIKRKIINVAYSLAWQDDAVLYNILYKEEDDQERALKNVEKIYNIISINTLVDCFIKNPILARTLKFSELTKEDINYIAEETKSRYVNIEDMEKILKEIRRRQYNNNLEFITEETKIYLKEFYKDEITDRDIDDFFDDIQKDVKLANAISTLSGRYESNRLMELVNFIKIYSKLPKNVTQSFCIKIFEINKHSPYSIDFSNIDINKYGMDIRNINSEKDVADFCRWIEIENTLKELSYLGISRENNTGLYSEIKTEKDIKIFRYVIAFLREYETDSDLLGNNDYGKIGVSVNDKDIIKLIKEANSIHDSTLGQTLLLELSVFQVFVLFKDVVDRGNIKLLNIFGGADEYSYELSKIFTDDEEQAEKEEKEAYEKVYKEQQKLFDYFIDDKLKTLIKVFNGKESLLQNVSPNRIIALNNFLNDLSSQDLSEIKELIETLAALNYKGLYAFEDCFAFKMYLNNIFISKFKENPIYKAIQNSQYMISLENKQYMVSIKKLEELKNKKQLSSKEKKAIKLLDNNKGKLNDIFDEDKKVLREVGLLIERDFYRIQLYRTAGSFAIWLRNLGVDFNKLEDTHLEKLIDIFFDDILNEENLSSEVIINGDMETAGVVSVGNKDESFDLTPIENIYSTLGWTFNDSNIFKSDNPEKNKNNLRNYLQNKKNFDNGLVLFLYGHSNPGKFLIGYIDEYGIENKVTVTPEELATWLVENKTKKDFSKIRFYSSTCFFYYNFISIFEKQLNELGIPEESRPKFINSTEEGHVYADKYLKSSSDGTNLDKQIQTYLVNIEYIDKDKYKYIKQKGLNAKHMKEAELFSESSGTSIVISNKSTKKANSEALEYLSKNNLLKNKKDLNKVQRKAVTLQNKSTVSILNKMGNTFFGKAIVKFSKSKHFRYTTIGFLIGSFLERIDIFKILIASLIGEEKYEKAIDDFIKEHDYSEDKEKSDYAKELLKGTEEKEGLISETKQRMKLTTVATIIAIIIATVGVGMTIPFISPLLIAAAPFIVFIGGFYYSLIIPHAKVNRDEFEKKGEAGVFLEAGEEKTSEKTENNGEMNLKLEFENANKGNRNNIKKILRNDKNHKNRLTSFNKNTKSRDIIVGACLLKALHPDINKIEDIDDDQYYIEVENKIRDNEKYVHLFVKNSLLRKKDIHFDEEKDDFYYEYKDYRGDVRCCYLNEVNEVVQGITKYCKEEGEKEEYKNKLIEFYWYVEKYVSPMTSKDNLAFSSDKGKQYGNNSLLNLILSLKLSEKDIDTIKQSIEGVSNEREKGKIAYQIFRNLQKANNINSEKKSYIDEPELLKEIKSAKSKEEKEKELIEIYSKRKNNEITFIVNELEKKYKNQNHNNDIEQVENNFEQTMDFVITKLYTMCNGKWENVADILNRPGNELLLEYVLSDDDNRKRIENNFYNILCNSDESVLKLKREMMNSNWEKIDEIIHELIRKQITNKDDIISEYDIKDYVSFAGLISFVLLSEDEDVECRFDEDEKDLYLKGNKNENKIKIYLGAPDENRAFYYGSNLGYSHIIYGHFYMNGNESSGATKDQYKYEYEDGNKNEENNRKRAFALHMNRERIKSLLNTKEEDFCSILSDDYTTEQYIYYDAEAEEGKYQYRMAVMPERAGTYYKVAVTCYIVDEEVENNKNVDDVKTYLEKILETKLSDDDFNKLKKEKNRQIYYYLLNKKSVNIDDVEYLLKKADLSEQLKEKISTRISLVKEMHKIMEENPEFVKRYDVNDLRKYNISELEVLLELEYANSNLGYDNYLKAVSEGLVIALNPKLDELNKFISDVFYDKTEISQIEPKKICLCEEEVIERIEEENNNKKEKLEEENTLLIKTKIINELGKIRGGLEIAKINGKTIKVKYEEDEFVIYSNSGLSNEEVDKIKEQKEYILNEVLNEGNKKLKEFARKYGYEHIVVVSVTQEEIEETKNAVEYIIQKAKNKSVNSIQTGRINSIEDKSKSYSNLKGKKLVNHLENELAEGEQVELTVEQIESCLKDSNLLQRLNKYEITIVTENKDLTKVENLFNKYNTELDTNIYFSGIKYRGDVDNVIIENLSKIATNEKNVREIKVILEPTQESLSSELLTLNKNCIWQLNSEQAKENLYILNQTKTKFRLTIDENITDKQIKNLSAEGLISGFVVEDSEQKEILENLLLKVLGKIKKFVSLSELMSAFGQTISKARSMEDKVMNSEEDFGDFKLTTNNAKTVYNVLEKSVDDFKADEEKGITKEQIEKELRECKVFSNETNNFIESLIEEERYEEAYGAIRGFAQLAVENVLMDILTDDEKERERMKEDFRKSKNITVRKKLLLKGVMALALGEDIEDLLSNIKNEVDENISTEQVISKGIRILNKKGQQELAEWEDKLPPLSEIEKEKETIVEEFKALFPVIEDRLQRVEVGKGSIGDIAVRGYKAMTAAA